MNIYDEKYYLEKCKSEIEKVLGIGESSTWKQRDFEYLCDQIFSKSNVTVSLSTIKRIWNVDYNSTPQSATLNALSVFLGFENWSKFKKTVSIPEQVVSSNHVLRSPVKNKRLAKGLVLSLIYATVFLGLGYVVFVLLKNRKIEESIRFVKFELKQTDTAFPNSVIFNYDVAGIVPQKLTIQQSWDPKMTVEANAKGHLRSCMYYYPGYFRAKLIADGKILKETDLVLATSDWFPVVTYSLFDSIPKYFQHTDFTKKNEVYISPADVEKNGIKTDKAYYLLYSYCRDYKLSSDNFSFVTHLKNSIDDGGLLCQSSMVYLACENGWINIPLCNRGCVSDINLYCSELYVDGKNSDLSAFGCDMNQWHELKMVNVNRHLTIYLDQKMIYQQSYKTGLGNIYEIAHVFKGCGKFKDVSLKKLNNQEMFKYPF